MSRIVAAINMTLDGYCDHTAGIVDAELHQHYTDLLDQGGTLVYGRVTYKLMEDYWPFLIQQPSGNEAMDAFAVSIDRIPKIVFSRSLRQLNWETARLAKGNLEQEVLELRMQPGKDVLVGSPGLIAALTQHDLIDEYQLCVHPVIAGKGLPLFKDISDRKVLKLVKTKSFASGVLLLYYESSRQLLPAENFMAE